MTRLIKFLSLLFCLSCSLNVPATIQIIPKIVGGSAAVGSQWPWATALVYKGLPPQNGLFCGGSLIASNWVLTAAHCVYDEYPLNFQVIINREKLSSNQGEVLMIDKIYVHPKFNYSTLSNDIALLKLSSPASATPIEILPSLSDQDAAGTNAIALGWGNTSPTLQAFPNQLQQATIPIISNAACKISMTGITPSMLCAGFSQGGVDTCEGDSGGPLVIYDNESSSWRIAGITSFGEASCGARGYYGVYTRADNYNDFITTTLCSAEQIPVPPKLTLSVQNSTVTANWSTANNATHYRLDYAPYPYYNLYPAGVNSIEMNQATRISVELPKGTAYYVGITAYNGNCKSSYSNIESFVIK